MKFILMHRTQRSSRWACGSVATATFALVTLAACDGAPANVASGVGSPTVLQASEVHVIGTSESIAVVEDLTVLSDGTVWVLNSVEPFFVGFGPDGDVLQVHGSRGGGPEEFRAPAGFVSGDIDGEAWVFDPIRHALIRISKPGTWSEKTLNSFLTRSAAPVFASHSTSPSYSRLPKKYYPKRRSAVTEPRQWVVK